MNIKYLILSFFCLFTNAKSFAQADTLTLDSTYKRTKAYSKYLFYYTPTEPVADYEKLFTKDQKSIFDSAILNFEKETSIEIAIITLDSIHVKHHDFDSLITVIGNRCKVGKKEKNNGIMIGISSTLRKIRINTGSGIEEILTDSKTKEIIDTLMIPEFKKNNFFEGLKIGLQKIMSILR